jgi:hypothetical protein
MVERDDLTKETKLALDCPMELLQCCAEHVAICCWVFHLCKILDDLVCSQVVRPFCVYCEFYVLPHRVHALHVLALGLEREAVRTPIVHMLPLAPHEVVQLHLLMPVTLKQRVQCRPILN